MRNVIIGLVGIVIGFSVGWALHRPQQITYSAQPLDLQKAISSGGLSIPCKVPYSLQYCATHPEAQ